MAIRSKRYTVWRAILVLLVVLVSVLAAVLIARQRPASHDEAEIALVAQGFLQGSEDSTRRRVPPR